MELIPYEQLSRLRLDAFFLTAEIRNLGPSVECALGYGGGQSRGFTAFFWPDDSPGVVGELQLDMRDNECPPAVASRILEAIGLRSLSPGQPEEDVLGILGPPEYSDGDGDECFYRFRVGVQYPYVVGCHISRKSGLNGLMVVRKDMWAAAG